MKAIGKSNPLHSNSHFLIFLASSILWGRSSLLVSGSSTADATPATTVGSPSASMGRGGQSAARLATNGQARPNSLATVEQVPRACVRRLVGYSSEVTSQTRTKAAPAEHLPEILGTLQCRTSKKWPLFNVLYLCCRP